MAGTIVPDEKDWTWVLDRICPECGFDVRTFDVRHVGDAIRANAQTWAEVLRGDETAVRTRPAPDRWSTLEYGAHVRDVYVLFLRRLTMMLDTDDPLFPNWDQDETAVGSRYDLQDPATVAVELGAAAEALADTFDAVDGDQWERRGRRSDGAAFTVDSFARYLIHDPVHHLWDCGLTAPDQVERPTVGAMTSATAIVEAAGDLAELIEANADDGERIRRLPLTTVKALRDAQLLRMCVPEAYGGPEVDPVTLVRAIEAVAHSDGGAGWCTMIASTTSSMASLLPEDAAREIYGDRNSITGGVFAPNGKGEAVTVDGIDGFSVSGRWAWGSGTQHCQWVLGGALCDDGTFRLCWFPQSAVTFHDTWYTTGMRGSGSLDYSVHEVFVPATRTIQPAVTRPVVRTPLSQFPNFTLLAAGVSAVGLGVARRALDELVELAQGKKPQYSSKTLAQSGFTQVELARAEGKLRAARAFLLDELQSAWDTAVAGDDVTVEARTGIRLAATHAATVGAEVADVAFTLAGGTAVYDTSRLGRCLRDAHIVTQHIQTAPKLNETIGKLLLGIDVDTSMF